MSVSVLGSVVDERFLQHRLRSTSLAGIIGGVLAISMFAYRFYIQNVWNWDLCIVAATIVLVKVGAMLWFRFTD